MCTKESDRIVLEWDAHLESTSHVGIHCIPCAAFERSHAQALMIERYRAFDAPDHTNHFIESDA